jgi:hypothetical protein
MSTELIRPNGDYSIQCARSAGATNYSCVDESTTDDTDYVYNGTDLSTKDDLYNLTDHVSGSGTINTVTQYGRFKSASSAVTDQVYFLLRVGGTTYPSSPVDITTSYTTYSYTWTNQPGGGAWGTDWSIIDGLIAGERLNDNSKTYGQQYCSQLWVVVDYTSVSTVYPDNWQPVTNNPYPDRIEIIPY